MYVRRKVSHRARDPSNKQHSRHTHTYSAALTIESFVAAGCHIALLHAHLQDGEEGLPPVPSKDILLGGKRPNSVWCWCDVCDSNLEVKFCKESTKQYNHNRGNHTQNQPPTRVHEKQASQAAHGLFGLRSIILVALSFRSAEIIA